MMDSANVAALLFATWFIVSCAVAPAIGRALALSRRRQAKVRVVRTARTVAKPRLSTPILARSAV